MVSIAEVRHYFNIKLCVICKTDENHRLFSKYMKSADKVSLS